MAIAQVQVTPQISTQGTSATATFPAATTKGNLLILCVGLQATTGTAGPVSSVTGGGVTTWRQAAHLANSGAIQDISIWWGVVDGTPSTTVTANYPSNVTIAGDMGAQEYSGASSGNLATSQPDQTHTNSGSSTTPGDTTTITNSGGGRLEVIAICMNSTTVASSGPTNSYTQDFSGVTVGTGPAVQAAHLILGAFTTTDTGATWTFSLSGAWSSARASFFPIASKQITVKDQAIYRAAVR